MNNKPYLKLDDEIKPITEEDLRAIFDKVNPTLIGETYTDEHGVCWLKVEGNWITEKTLTDSLKQVIDEHYKTP